MSHNLTCEKVRQLADSAEKQWVIFIAGNPDKTTQFVTWGKTPEDKVYASDLAEYIGEDLCGPPIEIHESFKLDAARNKAKLEELNEREKQVRALLIEMRKYVVHHGQLVGECVAWNRLKEMYEVGDEGIAQEENPA